MAYQRLEKKQLTPAFAKLFKEKAMRGKGFVMGDEYQGRFKNFKRVPPSKSLLNKNYSQLASGMHGGALSLAGGKKRKSKKQQGGKMLEEYTSNQVFEDEPAYFGQGPYAGEEKFLTAPKQLYNKFSAPKEFMLIQDHGIGEIVHEPGPSRIKGPTKLLVKNQGSIIKPAEQAAYHQLSNNYLL